MNKFSVKEKDELLKPYYSDKKTQIIALIVFSVLVLASAIIIIVLNATNSNESIEEELLPGFIEPNSITAEYIVEDPSKIILLFNDSYADLIHTLKIDGNKVNVTNEYQFDSQGEHTIQIYFKKPLKSMNNFFSKCEDLIEVNLMNLTSEKLRSTVNMFNGCEKLSNVNFTNFDASSLNNISNMFNGCSSLNSIDLVGFYNNELEDISGLFANCTNLTIINLHSLNYYFFI